MTSEVSVSKGVFVTKNGFQRSTKRIKNRVKRKNKFSKYIWYQAYKSLWKNIEAKLHVISSEMFSSTLSDLVKFVQGSCGEKLDEIPTAALLTGINMPDHEAQFSTLTKEIKENVSPHCVTLKGQDCHTLKLFVENMVNDFLNDEESEINDFYYEDEGVTYVKKSQCNFAVLQAWYENLYMNKSILNYSGSESPKKKMLPVAKPLVVIVPDLENFNQDVIQDFILIAHSYLNILPFILIFGVATSVKTLHRTMPYHVSSKTSIKVFSSQPSTVYLNNVLENVLLTDNCPFLLGQKIFTLFVDIFLFYDQSVTGFIKNFKYAMMEHFSQGNVWSLCSNENPADIFDSFSKEDYENLRKIYSFRDLVEREPSYKKQIKLLTDDRYLRDVAIDKILVLKKYIYLLHLLLRCLHILVRDLPQNPLGKQVRELYTNSNGITESPYFKECFKLLSFQSKDEFCTKLETVVGIIENNLSTKDLSGDLVDVYKKLEVYLKELKNIGNEQVQKDTSENVLMEKSVNRQQFKQNLMKISQTNSMNSFGKLREEIVDYLRSIFEKYLIDYQKFHFHEIFFFNNNAIENQIIGTHRSAIHTALNNPQTYLQCSCCETRNDGNILPTMPDLSIVYKLHLECGKMINLYDWLQAFLSIVDPTDEEDESKRRVDPELQARFTQAIVEMEYLGFIKTSRRKTDHVQRLTWGG